MAFPVSPTNGQVTVVNQVSYQYSSATNSWTRILSTANVITANTIAVNGALTVGTTISAVGNITAGSGNFFIGNGSQLTGVAASSAGFPISSGNSNIAATASANIYISVAGTSNVAVFATTGEYITGVLSASGTVTGGNLATAGTASATGNITGGNILTAGLVSATGTVTGSSHLGAVVSVTANITGGNVLTGGLISSTGTITSAANITGGNLLTGGLISAAGTLTTGSDISIVGNIVDTGPLWINTSSNGNINLNPNGSGQTNIPVGILSVTANVVGGNVLTAGLISATSTITSAANITGGNILTAGLVSATGNVTGNYILGNGALLTGVITSVANINNGTSNVTVVSSGGNVTVGVGGTGNVAVFATTGEYITGELSANGNVTGGNVLTGGLVSATANVTGGNLLSGGIASVTGNITGGNINTGGKIVATNDIQAGSGTTTTIGQLGVGTGGNVTANGFISATGNILSSGLLSVTGNITGGNVNTPKVFGATGLTISTGSGDLALTPSGNINASNKYINNLLDPVLPQDAVSKQYVDNAVSSGITIHTPVLVESPTALNATYAQGGTTATVTSTVAGNTVVFGSAISPQVNDQYWFTSAFSGILADTAYFVVSAPNTSAAVLSTSYNGAPVANITGATGLTQPVRINSGIGATLTNAGANATLTIDGVTLSNTNRVLVYTQANAVHNGVYVVSQAGNATTAWQLTRSTDTDVYGPKSTEELDVGDYFFVQSGSTGAGESYVMTAPEGTFIIGYNNLTFTQFSSSQVYTANTAAGLSLIGTVFNAKVDGVTTAFDGGGNISVKASANLTTPNIGVATGTSLSVTGNVTGGNLLTGGLISATSTITSGANITGGNVLTGGLVSATGTVTGSSLLGSVVSASANVIGGNVLTGGLISATSSITSAANITGANLFTQGVISALSTITSASNITGGNILTGGLVSATGNVTGNYILGNGALLTGVITSVANINNGTSNVTVVSSGGNVTVGVGGTSNVAVFATTGEYITGVLSASGNITGGNLLTAGLISATSTITSAANITGGNLLTAGIISATGNIRGGNVTASNYYYANGIAIVNYTASTTPPASPTTGWQWYNTSTDVLYEYITDGTTPYWVDISSPAFAGGVVANVSIAGSMLVNANASYDIGSSSQTFRDVYAQNYYGNGASLSGIITSVGNINNGTSNVTVVSSGGNITHNVAGTSNIGVWYNAGLSITGDLTVTGNATLTGNILGDRVQNGTTSIDIQTAGGNANVNIGGTGNLAVFSPGNLVMTGNINPSANITYDLGTSTQRWKDIYLANSTIYLGAAQITANATAVTITNPAGGATVLAGGSGATAVTGATVSVTGNITGGNLTVSTGTVTLGNIVNANGNGVGNIGSSSLYFNTIFGKATTAQYADLAENYLGDAAYVPGTVLDFDGEQEVTLSTRDSSKRVAGVVSTNPAHLMNSTLDGAHVTAVALAGRVPTQVTGKIAKGDLMVSAGNGRARAEANPSTGTVIGKALENFDGGEGTIEIVISMQ